MSTLFSRLEQVNEELAYNELDEVVKSHNELIASLRKNQIYNPFYEPTWEELIEKEEKVYEQIKERHELVFKEYHGRNSSYNNESEQGSSAWQALEN